MKISEWIKAHAESGEFDGEPYIAVPNMPGREPFTAEGIIEALKNEDIARRQENEQEEKKDPSRNVGPRERLSVESALIRL